MKAVRNTILFLAMAIGFCVAGCEGCNSTTEKDAAKTDAAKTPDAKTEAKTPAAVAASSIPDSPDGTFNVVSKDLTEGKVGTVWAAMPASYQKSTNDLVHEFAGKMDAELWDKGFVLSSKLAAVLRDKKAFILNTPMLAQLPIKKADLEKNWDGIVSMFDTIANSELAKLNNVKTLDMGAFLSGTGTKIVQESIKISELSPEKPMDQLKGMKATMVKTEGDKATLKLSRPNAKEEEVEFMKVEGKWIPADLNKEWPEIIKEARAGLAEISGEEMAKNKPQIIMMMASVEGIIDQLAKADTQEKFDAAVEGIGKMGQMF